MVPAERYDAGLAAISVRLKILTMARPLAGSVVPLSMLPLLPRWTKIRSGWDGGINSVRVLW